MNMKMGQVKVGFQVLLEGLFEFIKNKRVGLVTNHTGVTGDMRHITDVLHESPKAQLAALFGPEHGIRGDVQNGLAIESYVDERTSLPVYSLYGEAEKPTTEMLSGIDILVFDIQDVGARYYTYSSTMSCAMEAAADAEIPFVVLDRPNPVNGTSVEGNVLDPTFKSFVGRYPIPVRHGLTVGELAALFNAEYAVNADLEVVRMEGWHRDMWFDETGLTWVQPSPNIPTLDTAIVYPGTCLLEGTNVSEGRGTTKPFEQVGAPWIDSPRLTAELRSRTLPGVLFRQTHFTPASSKYSRENCGGVQLHVTDRRLFRPFETGLHVVDAIGGLHPETFGWVKNRSGSGYYFDLLAGTNKIREQLSAGVPVSRIVDGFQEELSEFADLRKEYLLYH
jgi:uncharacterized protein YbbC (DUF1343 family)